MKRTNKLLIALLSATCLTAGAFSIAACNNGNDTTDGIVAVYNQYVADTEAAGGTALSYTEWLNSVLALAGNGTDGTDGTNGKSAYELAVAAGYTGTEAEWLASLKGGNGTNGKSAYELYRDNEYAHDRVPLSEEEWLASLKGEPGQNGVGTPGAAGLGIKSVEFASDGKSLVITYTDGTSVTVPYPQGAEVHEHSYGDEYIVFVPGSKENQGLAYYKCEGCDHYEWIALPFEFGEVTEDTFNAYKELQVGQAVTYKFTAEYEEWFTGFGEWVAPDLCITPDEAVYYNVIINDENVSIDGAPAQDKLFIKEGEEAFLRFFIDPPFTYDEETYEFTVTLEALKVPKAGSIERPISLNPDESVEIKDIAADEEVYFLFSGSDVITSLNGNYKLECADGTSVTYLGAAIDGEIEEAMENGQIKSIGNHYLKATSTKGSVSFKLVTYYYEGEQGNPKSLALNTATETEIIGSNYMYGTWYKFEVTTAGRYTVEGMAGMFSFSVYDDNDGSVGDEIDSSGAKLLITEELQAGTYYLHAASQCTFKVRAYSSETDDGFTESLPKTVTAGKIDLTAEEMHFKFVANKAGYFAIQENDCTFFVFPETNPWDYGNTIFDSRGALRLWEVAEGDVLYITTSYYPAQEGEPEPDPYITISLLDELPPVNYTFKVVGDDGSNVGAGVTITLADGVSGTTSEDGTVTLNIVPDVYNVTVSDVAGYKYLTAVKTPKSAVDCEVEIVLAKLYTLTVTVKNGDTPVSGLQVTIREGYGMGFRDYATETTDNDGVVTFSIYQTSYRFRIDSSDYEITNQHSTNADILPDAVPTTATFELTVRESAINITSGENISVKAGKTYIFKAGWSGDSTITITTDGVYFASIHSSSINADYVDEDGIFDNSSYPSGMVNVDATATTSDGKATAIRSYDWNGDTLTITFSADCTINVSLAK